MRTLGSIKQISAIQPIEGKDRIVLATVDGWHVIVKKDEFHEGDLCVYVEIDSVMPKKEEYSFLEKSNYRIKTMKMAGVISQGICFPISILPEREGGYILDEDVTDIIGIKQYEPTMDKEPDEKTASKHKYPRFLMRFSLFRKLVLPRKKPNGFPSFLSKTDETRVQSMPWILEDKGEWVATEKVDGQSGTFCLVRHRSILPFMKPHYEFIVCSRNLRLPKPDGSSYWRVADKYSIKEALRTLIGENDWVCIQGECIAPNVQGNKYKVQTGDVKFFAFNLIYPDGRMPSVEAHDKLYDVKVPFVPIVNEHYKLPSTVDEILEYAHGPSVIGDTIREGLVFRSIDGKQSFKAVDPLFLLQYDA